MPNYTVSQDDSKAWKKEKLDAIRNYHWDLIKDLGISAMDFNMKMGFYDQKNRYVIGVFPSEFLKEKGTFIELVNRVLDPIDKERKVYRIPPTTCFEEEYDINEKGMYLIPIEELRIVNAQSVAISKSSAVTSSDQFFSNKSHSPAEPSANPVRATTPVSSPALNVKEVLDVKEDAPYTEMTIRDFMAIQTGLPVSTKNWLNKLVQDNQSLQKLPF